ncbi:armadillo repeat-containing protein 7-like isoform X2 [Lytechinus variegatus]|nr:armadillo repeat-containing protein 7-like isoform X1 [Lytechinus variegatus]XP_041475716.1 armadillo repeat-containing protein 7-like isoform X2 [Lytechinus variegatus]XP_041475717.1 armadillo repeat-containing protein 7-like isoform X2 [Lytechinus variegatus]
MFQSRDRLEARTPLQHGIGRLQHLQNLMIEFQQTEDDGCREQVLANLANFAYDPINYEYLRQLNAVDLFLDTLTEPSERLVEFGIGGLCNLVLDKENKAHILANDGVSLVKDCLSSPNEEIVLSAITTLMYLMTPASKQEITAPSIVECMQRFAGSSSKRLSNLANVFLQDYCTPEQRLMAESPSLTTGSAVGIPLPPEPKQETR